MTSARSKRLALVAVSVAVGVVSSTMTVASASTSAQMPTMTQSYRVLRSGDPSLPEHTIIRPAELSRVPVFLGDGWACVVSPGGPSSPRTGAET